MAAGRIPQLTKEQEDDILKSLNYTREQLKMDTILFRKWLNEQEHFPESRKNEPDCFLVSFLVECKGSLEKAKKKIDKYYSIRGHGDLFSNRGNFDYMEEAYNFMVYAPLPKALPDGTAVTILALHDRDVDKFCPLIGIKTAILYIEYRLRQGSGIHGGEIVVADGAGMKTSHAAKFSPSLFKPLITFILEASPVRMKKYISINTDPIFETFANAFVKPFLAKKLQDKIVITSGCDLTDYFDTTDLLPSCYGGKEADRMTISRAFKNTMREGLAPIIADLEEPTDESKRPKLGGYVSDPHFGTFGSIKTLVTD